MYNQLIISTYVIQFIVLSICLAILFKLFFSWSYPQIWTSLSILRKAPTPPKWLKVIFVITQSTLNRPHAKLFEQAGFLLSYSYYVLLYRLACCISIALIVAFTVLLARDQSQMYTLFLLISITITGLLLLEPIWLKLWLNYRKKQIVLDIYQLSSHLLYFSDSNMNIYFKIKKCLPYTKAIRRDLELLLMEWTQDTDYALKNLKGRLACHEAISFIDTINALKQHQDESFYDLLRERIEEYKEQLDIANDSRKETTSYILFVLAGIPILYTFQLFIYPWVKEVQELLSKLN